MTYPFIALIGLIGGVLSGLFGIGGGLVIVPGLVLLAGFAPNPRRRGPAGMTERHGPAGSRSPE